MTITVEQYRFVWQRANDCCEYCRLPSTGGTVKFQVDHIIPLKHDGTDDNDNLCLSCFKCNSHKSSDVGGFDPDTNILTRLFHPRQQRWDEHFSLEKDMTITGLTPIGRTTVRVLRINDENRVETRQLLAEIGDYPCQAQSS